MKKINKKLVLHRETVLRLDEKLCKLAVGQGGGGTDACFGLTASAYRDCGGDMTVAGCTV